MDATFGLGYTVGPVLGAFLYNLDPLPDDMYIAYLPLAHVLELLGRRNNFEYLFFLHIHPLHDYFPR